MIAYQWKKEEICSQFRERRELTDISVEFALKYNHRSSIIDFSVQLREIIVTARAINAMNICDV